MNTLGWTDNSGLELFTFGWIDADGVIDGLLDATISGFDLSFQGQNIYINGQIACNLDEFSVALKHRSPVDIFALARDMTDKGIIHANPVIVRLRERLKGSDGPRFH